MNNKFETNLSDIPGTMLITLYARAEETMLNKDDAFLKDEKALEIYNKLNYDFSKFKKAKMSLVGCCIRASLIDKEINDYITENPGVVVLQIGAGLDARYERLGKPKVSHWYDLDLKESIDLRRKFIEEGPNNSFIECSMFDYSWIDVVAAYNKPILIVAEGVFMYFERKEIKAFMNEIACRLKNVTILFDMLAFAAVGHAKQHDAMRHYSKNAEFKWSELDSKVMETWNRGIKVAKEYYMSDYDRGRYPLIARILYKLPFFYKKFNQRIVKLEINK